eukprot:scaffold50165_cov36-Phaeocystis_antarctica.AAC.1
MCVTAVGQSGWRLVEGLGRLTVGHLLEVHVAVSVGALRLERHGTATGAQGAQLLAIHGGVRGG